ncbi:hypothetical protein Ait01nite_041120 [Actinoplanes italicus]|uniref:Uncharacterized protein n=1 Tax=Actinoplanes italicus TaxID=113567 RepID=A0A2T0K2G1_9ACTN|nr:hypothetical protein [Actinoplanes italicus]PRX16800.1 hypothetical protein CLV67_118131 [Actinoplanes italicus]GIE31067.1 hypothetical protein Ait01nite_041120 [Actinoplanes italicus]
MTRVERRYARLVRLYPARYPREEILDTVLQVNGAFRVREATALIAGAMRARTGADVQRTPSEFAFSAARLAALALLVYAAAKDVLEAVPLDVRAVVTAPDGLVQFAVVSLCALVLHLTAMVALSRGAHRLAAIAAVLALPVATVAQWRHGMPWGADGYWATPLAALLTVVLLFAPRRERSSPLFWLLAVVPAIVVLPTGSGQYLGPSWFIQQQMLLILVTVALLWSFVDARVPLAVAAVFACNVLTGFLVVLISGYLGDGAILLGLAITTLPAIALVAAATLSRRRSLI